MNTAAERNDLFADANVTFEYTRSQAIADGVLIDLSASYPVDTRMFKYPLACTSAVWTIIENAAEAEQLESPAVYVWDISYMALVAIKSATSGLGELPFKVTLPLTGNGITHKLKLVCGPGDKGEAVLTIMLPEED